MSNKDLKFDMSGVPKGARRPLARPLDGRAGRLLSIDGTDALPWFDWTSLEAEEWVAFRHAY